MATRIPTAARDAAVSAVVGLVDAGASPGTLSIYTGAQPAAATDAASGTLLVSFALNDPAFAAVSVGSSSLDVDPALSANAVADGTPGWYRVSDSTGATVYDGSLTGIDPWSVGMVITITGGSLTQPATT